MLRQLDDAWKAARNGNKLSEVRNGVYVIALTNGLSINYKNNRSPIIYIGRGAIYGRLRSHFHNVPFSLFRSLRGAEFRFYMEAFGDRRSPHLYKDVEGKLINSFVEMFGEKPLVNKIGARQESGKHKFDETCFKPFDMRGMRLKWIVRPTEHNDWFREMEDR